MVAGETNAGGAPDGRAPTGGGALTNGRALAGGGGTAATAASKMVLLTLATAQFLMVLDSSVMNVSIAYVAKDVGTTVSGVQAAITMYALVMAAFMITGGTIGAIIGSRKAFTIGCVIYGAGALVTSLAPNLGVLMLGWSVVEGLGAALILPAAVALVASNFAPKERPAAYGLLVAAASLAIAAGPLIGGAVTTFGSWRWVFAGEMVFVFVILGLTRRMADSGRTPGRRLDLVGVALSVVGLAAVVFGVLKTSEWGWVTKAGAPSILGLSPSLWLILGGLLVCFLFLYWQHRLEQRGGQPLIKPSMLDNRQLTGGLLMGFFQFLVQGGVGFVVPLFLSVVLGLSALMTGLWLFPMSVALLLASLIVPRRWPKASPRAVARIGLGLFLLGTLLLMIGIEPGSGAWVVAVPLALMGLGAGAMASQLGAVIVSSVPDAQSAEVGGLQNTVTNLGSSLGTALAGSVLIAVLSASFLAGVVQSPQVPEAAKQKAQVYLSQGVPFVSNTQLRAYLQHAKASEKVVAFLENDNVLARVKALQTALALVALLCVVALFCTGRLPRIPAGAASAAGTASADGEAGPGAPASPRAP